MKAKMRFHVVDETGEVLRYEDKRQAIEALYRATGGALDLVPGEKEKVEKELDERGKYHFELLTQHFSPAFAAIYRSDGPSHLHINGHIAHRPKTMQLVQQIARKRRNFKAPASGDVYRTRLGDVYRLGRFYEDGTAEACRPDYAGFYAVHTGHASVVGSGSGILSINRLLDTGETVFTVFTVPLDGQFGPNRGVMVQIPTRVWTM